MGSSNIKTKIIQLKETSQKFIKPELLEDIIDKTYFKEDEIFRLIKRFETLNPDEDYTISINDLKNLEEFKFSPFIDLFFNAIGLYRLIFDYIQLYYPNFKSEQYDIEALNQEAYEIQGKPIDNSTQVKYKYILKYENPDLFQNKTNIIDFRLFCLIMNEFNSMKPTGKKMIMSFRIFDIDCDEYITYKDLKNYHYYLFRYHDIEDKDIVIEKFSIDILDEYRKDDLECKIDYSNFQKILLSTNFNYNIFIEP